MTTVVALATAFLVQPALAMNKCTNADGKVVFQDLPCAPAAKAEALELNPASGRMEKPIAVAIAKEPASSRDARMNAALARGEVIVGMNLSEVHQVLGLPNTINTANYNGRSSDQLIFERNGRRLYVYLDNGLVSAVQDREGTSAPPKATATRCPTEQEIKNTEAKASSIRLGEAERVELLRQAGEMRKCGRG